MSKEEKNRILGQLVTDHKEAKEAAALLRAKITRTGRLLMTIGQTLQSPDLSIIGPALDQFHEDGVELSGVQAWVAELKQAETRLAELAAHLKEFGL